MRKTFARYDKNRRLKMERSEERFFLSIEDEADLLLQTKEWAKALDLYRFLSRYYNNGVPWSGQVKAEWALGLISEAKKHLNELDDLADVSKFMIDNSIEVAPDMTKTPKVFISYSHDSAAHKKWVAELAMRLVDNGVETVLDQWSMGLGDDIAAFMENSLTGADRVLVICTPNYVTKANAGMGGVGYEKMIVSSELVSNAGTNKFVPIIREKTGNEAVPRFLASRLYIDFTENNDYEDNIELLLREIHKVPSIVKPPLGKNPFAKTPLGSEATPTSKHTKIISGDTLSAEVAYKLAVEIAGNDDFVGWNKLIHKVKPEVYKRLLNWRQIHERLDLGNTETKQKAVDQAVEDASPLIAIALAGVESGRDRLKDQKGLLIDIIDITGWNYSGWLRVVHLPYTLGYIYHNIHGSLCTYTGQLDLAVALSATKIRCFEDHKYMAVIEKPEIMGWPETLGRSSAAAWEYITGSYPRWSWLAQMWETEGDFRISLIAYYMLLNIYELVLLIKQAQVHVLDSNDPLNLLVPLAFVGENENLNRKAFQLLIRDRSSLSQTWEREGIIRADVEKAWSRWMDHCHYWTRNQNGNGFRSKLAHSDLFQAW